MMGEMGEEMGVVQEMEGEEAALAAALQAQILKSTLYCEFLSRHARALTLENSGRRQAAPRWEPREHSELRGQLVLRLLPQRVAQPVGAPAQRCRPHKPTHRARNARQQLETARMRTA